jgi:hypothetical protein
MAEPSTPHEAERPRVFISYASADHRRVNELASLMKTLGHDGFDIFMDYRFILSGRRWRDQLGEALRASDVLLVFWTQHAAESRWVRWEFETFARDFPDRPLVPVRGDTTYLPETLQLYQYLDLNFRSPLDEFFDIVRALKEMGVSNRKMGAVVFQQLARMQDLDTVEHYGSFERYGSMIIGVATLCRMITYSQSLVGQPFRYYSCFISYSSQDESLAKQLYTDLKAKGVSCWFPPEDLKIGDEFRSRIDESIQVYDRLLIILSEDSVKSRWVQKEVETAFEKERQEDRIVLFPIRIDDAVMRSTVGWAADIRRQRHIGDFRQWRDHDAYQRALSRLLRDLIKADI